jgi:ABC-type amino acid transport substrate-binding protein
MGQTRSSPPGAPSMIRTPLATASLLVLLLAACGSSSDRRPAQPQASERAVETTDGAVRGSSFAEAQAAGRAQLAMLFVPATGFAGIDENGRPEGVTVALLRDFADFVAREHRLQVDLRWIAQPEWRRFYAQVRDAGGGVFGVGNVTITEPRRAELDFSAPYMRNVAVLVTHARHPELQALDAIGRDFAGLGALVFPGTLHEERVAAIAAAHFADLRTAAVASNDELIQRVASEDRWFAWIDAYNFWRAQQQGVPLRRHPVGDDGSETFGVILPRGSDWTPVIDAFLAADGGYVDSPRFRGHLERHLGTELATMISGQQ